MGNENPKAQPTPDPLINVDGKRPMHLSYINKLIAGLNNDVKSLKKAVSDYYRDLK